MTGITYTTVRAVYHGGRRSVQLDVLDSICQVLGVQPGDIYQYYQNESDIKSMVLPKPDAQVENTIISSGDSTKTQHGSADHLQEPGWRVW